MTGGGASNTSTDPSKKKGKKATAYPAQLLSEINVTRARIIASHLRIPNYGKIVKDSLIPLIREQLALAENCTFDPSLFG